MDVVPPALIKLVLLLLVTGTSTGIQLVTVNTTYGAVKGRVMTLDSGEEIDTFYSIPYAKPPVGDNRFRVSKPVVYICTLKATKCFVAFDFDVFKGQCDFNIGK